MQSHQRILIVAVNWLGDLIFMTPAIRAIRRAYPEGYIACLVPPRGVDLLCGNPHLDACIPFEESRGWRGILQWWPLVRRLKQERFDTVFLFHRSFSRTLAACLAGIRFRIGYRTWKRGWLLTEAVDPLPKDSVHKVVGYLKIVEAAGLQADGMHYDVGLLPEDKKAADALLRQWGVCAGDRLVALHPGANWQLKRWPARCFASLADQLTTQCQVKVVFIGDQKDLPLVEQITRQMKTTPLVATGRTSFRQLGALLASTRLLISNDSGPLHLGLAVGIPVVGLFGPTVPDLSGPLDRTKAVALFGSIGCPVPCYQLQCPVNLCMHEIRVEQVLQAAENFLNREDSCH